MIKLEVLGSMGHRRFEAMTPEETEKVVKQIEDGKIRGMRKGAYFLMNKNTKRLVGKIRIRDNQELVMIPAATGG